MGKLVPRANVHVDTLVDGHQRVWWDERFLLSVNGEFTRHES